MLKTPHLLKQIKGYTKFRSRFVTIRFDFYSMNHFFIPKVSNDDLSIH